MQSKSVGFRGEDVIEQEREAFAEESAPGIRIKGVITQRRPRSATSDDAVEVDPGGEPMWRALDGSGLPDVHEEGEPRRALVVDEGVEAFGTRGSPDRDPFDRCQRGGAQFWEVVSRKRANDDPLAAPFPRHPPTLPNGHRPRTPPS